MSHRRHRIFLKSGVTPDLTEQVLEEHFKSFGEVSDVYIPKDPVTRQSRGFGYVTFVKEDTISNVLETPTHRILGKDIPVGRADPRPPDRRDGDRFYRPDYGRRVQQPQLPGISNGGHSGLAPYRGGGGPLNDFLGPPPDMMGMNHLPPTPGGYLPPQFHDMDVPPSGFHNNRPTIDVGGLDLGYTSFGPPSGASPPITADSRFFRIFVGGVPECITEKDMKAHFERYGVVKDVYFPTDRQSGRRRGFCYVRFTTMQSAEAAAARSPRTISGQDIGEIKVAQPRPPENGPGTPVPGMQADGIGGPYREPLIGRGHDMYGPRPIREQRSSGQRYRPY